MGSLRRPADRLFARTCRRKNCIRRIRICRHTDRADTARGDAVVPKNPERVAVYDWAALDTLTELGVNVGATTAPVRVDYLQPAFDKAATVGTLFEPDYEALHRSILSLSLPAGRARKRMNSWRKTRPP